MFRFAPYVFKSLWRHRARTLLTVSGTAVGLFVFAVVEAAQGGLADLTRGAAADRTLVVYQAGRICPGSSRLPERYADDLAAVPGVRDVLPVLVYLNNCRASLDTAIFQGVPPDKLRTFRDLRLVSGDWPAFTARSDAAVVGQALARRRGLVPGGSFTLGDVTVSVAGVFAAASPAEETIVYTHLPFLQQAPGRGTAGLVTLLEVRLNEGADAAAIAREIDSRCRSGPVPTDTRTKGAFQAGMVGDLAELIGWANALGYACVGLVLALAATTAVMAVQDRVREHAVLQAIGFTGQRVFALVLAEGVLVSTLGGMLGVGAALAILGWMRPAISTEGVTMALVPTADTAVRGIAVAFLTGLVAAAPPAFRAARAEIVTALRHVG
jgi:putative ABC transport system permease protein